jgi:hypothetical protein
MYLIAIIINLPFQKRDLKKDSKVSRAGKSKNEDPVKKKAAKKDSNPATEGMQATSFCFQSTETVLISISGSELKPKFWGQFLHLYSGSELASNELEGLTKVLS